MNEPSPALGELLVRVGVVTQEQLQAALAHTDKDQKTLAQVLVALGYATETNILKAVGIRLGIPTSTSFAGHFDVQAARLIPEALARRHLAVPLFVQDGELTVGMVNPTDTAAIEEIARATGKRVRPVMTTLPNLFDAVQQAYGAKPAAGAAVPVVDEDVVGVAEGILQEAMTRKASDIHLEPGAGAVRLRYRVDGMLQDAKTFPKELEGAITARFKILSSLDITETRLPQDGHLRFGFAGRDVDVRVSSLPTVYGEKLVLRILDSAQTLRSLTQLGMSDAVRASFETAIRAANGLVLITGPTGSGKTTTIYAALSELNDATRNLVTLEDPVEYRIAGVNQVETHAKIGLTFAAGLRSILRQDPNVILVGEIRDKETAEIAVESSITGHMVFSTLHTNDAVTTIDRLVDMGIERFLIAAALRGVMAQRLLRLLCPACKRPHPVSDAERAALGDALSGGGAFFDAPGCAACFNTGYAGRAAIYEWFPVGHETRELVLKNADTDALEAAAVAEGMITLQKDAMAKARAGVTSLAEVIRVTRESEEA